MDLIIIILAVAFVISLFGISIKINYMCDAIRTLEDRKTDVKFLNNSKAYLEIRENDWSTYYTSQQMFTMILNKLDCKIEPEYEDCKLVKK